MSAEIVASPLDAYFAAIDCGDADAAAACFSEHAVYVRPEYRIEGGFLGKPLAEGERVALEISGVRVMRGRSAIAAYLHNRGKQPHHHEIRVVGSGDNVVFVEGRSLDGPYPDLIFFSEARFDEHGLIERYVSLAADLPANDDGTTDDF